MAERDNMEKLETEKDDIEYVIDNLDTIINTLSVHKKYELEVKELKGYKAIFEEEFDHLKEELEELYEEEREEQERENAELEREYWRGAI